MAIVSNMRFDYILIDRLEQDENQPRQSFESNGELSSLNKSVAEFGVIQPLLVNETADGRLRIIDGHRRHTCLKQLKSVEAPCIIYDNLSEADVELVRFQAQNNCRR